MPMQLKIAAAIAAVLAFIAGLDLIRKKNIPVIPEESPQPSLTVSALSFADLDGWERDELAAALEPFKLSCSALSRRDPTSRMLKRPHPDHPILSEVIGLTEDWQAVCAAAEATMPHETRAFFENNFVPVMAQFESADTPSDTGLFTGYFEPTYRASHTVTAEQSAPVLTRPDDLVMVDLGSFRKELTGKRIAGRVKGGKLIPYSDHKELTENPPNSSRTLGFIDPNELLFLQIQGSGRLEFDNGQIIRVGYAAQNGHTYVAVGRTLVRDGHMALADVTMQSIREWLRQAEPTKAATVRYSNPSYVFFTLLDNLPNPALGPLGAQGLQLTPERSAAIDYRFYPYGAPVWIETTGSKTSPAIRKLFIAQDTGGAIRGVQRADIFFGAGESAANAAGLMKAAGRMMVLVPKSSWARWHDGTQ